MLKKTAYDKVTGKLLFHIEGQKNFLNFMENAETGYLDGHLDLSAWTIVDGELVPVPDEVVDAIDLENMWKDLREQRNLRLSACDWTQVPDAPVNQVAWAAYRQALRDLPDNTTDPENPDWPVPPGR